LQKIIAETGASGITSMGKVMGLAAATLDGTAEGKTISSIVKSYWFKIKYILIAEFG
jgi:uncharacterized protein YqeY